MKRDEFIKQFFILTLGIAIGSPTLIKGMNKKHSKNNLKVIIVGAGASGLYAGYILNKLGVDFTILEADTIHGGRVGKFVGFADYDIDIGGQWLHGLNNIIGELIQNEGISLTLDDTPYAYYFENKIVKKLPKNPFIFEEGKMPDISFKNYAKLKGFSPSYDEIINSIAGFNGADADEISTSWNYTEMSNSKLGDGDYKFENTYFDILDNFYTIKLLKK
jgi:lysine-specific histone demethylase 1B